MRSHLRRRARAGKEDGGRLAERLGHPSQLRPAGRLVWLHAASVGEALSVLPLVDALGERWPSVTPLLTTGTPTSAALMAQRLRPPALHQYAPVDQPAAVHRFLDFWRPDLALWVESELWPNTLVALRRRHTPALLVNARMSQRSARRWSHMVPVAKATLGAFASVLAQSDGDAARFRALGAPDVRVAGNLKYAAPALPADPAALTALAAATQGRPRWLAASTHDGEEALAAAVHSGLAGRHRGLLTVIVPRHPARGPAIAATVRAQGLAVALRSAAEPLASATAVYIADTLGELGLWYRLCPVVFLGGSLVPHGGHNPLEPARLGCAVLSGPHTQNFRDLADGLAAAGALIRVADQGALVGAVDRLLSQPAHAARLGRLGQGVAEAERGVLAHVTAALAPWMAPLA